MDQKKRCFCPTSREKTLKGALIALSGAIVVLLLLIAYGIGIDKAVLVSFLAWFIPTAVNAGRQWYKGA